jgi:phage/plasmid-associated DNA primase
VAIQSNDLPNLSKRDEAIAKRLVKINFPFEFVDEPTYDLEKPLDIGLKEHVIEDDDYAYGLLFRALNVWEETKGKLYVCAKVREETMEYLKEQNPLREWFEVHFDVIEWDPHNSLSASQMLDLYKADNGTNGTHHLLTQTAFGKWIKELCPSRKSNIVKYACQRRHSLVHHGVTPL